MIFSVNPECRLIDWSKLFSRLPLIGSHIAAFVIGGWIVSIRAQEGSLPYFKRAAHQVEQVKAETGLPPLAALNCQKRRADIAEVIAGQALAITNFDATPKDLINEIPDCPEKPAAK